MTPLFALVTRILAFIGKELVETVRRPAAVVSLVVGPLALILAFGAGYDGSLRSLSAILVVPPESGLPADVAAYRDGTPAGMEIVDVVPDIEQARERVDAREADLVIAAPADLRERFRAGEQSVIRVEYSQVDPIRSSQADLLARQVASEANRMLIEEAVAESESYALVGAPEPYPIPPEVVAAPTRSETANLAPTTPSIVNFFGPAALALIIQHLAVTLLALSLVAERGRGRLEILRIAPVSTAEILLGKSLALAALAGLVAVITMVGLVAAGVPLLSGALPAAAVIALVTAASLALGVLVGALSTHDRQAVQLSLLILLASVFFSGFVLAIDEFRPVAQAFAWLLPVTHGIALLQDLMLRGLAAATANVAALVGLTAAYGLLGWLVFRRAVVQP
jgi:ABC-2 type transport system permease protein